MPYNYNINRPYVQINYTYSVPFAYRCRDNNLSHQLQISILASFLPTDTCRNSVKQTVPTVSAVEVQCRLFSGGQTEFPHIL
jgi:hypothetical protein